MADPGGKSSSKGLAAALMLPPRFAAYCLRRFLRDGGPRMAGSLSYSTLLAIVPILAIALALLSYVPLFDDVYYEVLTVIFANFLPDAGLEISEQIAIFIENARRVTGLGFLALLATAYLLLSAVTTAFNAVWRVSAARPLLPRFLLQWGVLTLWPLLLAASLSISSFQVANFPWLSLDEMGGEHAYSWVLPYLLVVLAFASLYAVIPARAVDLRHALAGAAVAAVLFSLLRRAFGFYVLEAQSYEAVYGALAAVPLFLLWMYLSWAIVLLGAEITAALPEWLLRRRLGDVAQTPGSRLALGLAILSRLAEAQTRREGVKEAVLLRGLPTDLGHFQDLLAALRRADYLRRRRGRWLLTKDLARVPLKELLRDLDLTWDPGEAWPAEVSRAVSGLSRQRSDHWDLSVGETLEAGRL